ncbi:MAG TPA: sulfite exporter TauE/SafE family protein [Verrucomicrobiales bacterium]|nr:permease [Roseibacillus sp.]MCH2332046.1 sulfite exporter TauE/SafE family protein [Roseibacillus sp.]HCQ34235.1 sulfite exporter TauE/SafE family protein [Verrucomicrobiales bacterium]|tara:strand:+ start:888 stop:1259 length:372 start_codon:yes stop_codon:yes gene_type:complete
MKIVISGLLVGVAAGLVGALCGVGGGILMVPAFVLALGMGQKHAVATSLAVVVVTALAGTANHVLRKSDLIDWRLVAFTAVGAAVAAWYGTELMRTMSNQQLTRIFGVLLILVGARMLMLKAA